MEDILSFNFFADISTQSLFSNVLIIVIVAVLAFIIGAIAFFLLKKKKELKIKKHTICWWEETPDSMIPIDQDEAVEVVHPGTRLRAFYIKKKDMWLPRFTRSVKQGLYYITITPQRELVNWIPTKLSQDMKKAGLKYDHTDMLWAAENLREFIKKNYRDKSVKWWQAYQQVITTVVFIVFLTICMAVIIYMLRGVTGDIGSIANQLAETLKQTQACQANSGLIGA